MCVSLCILPSEREIYCSLHARNKETFLKHVGWRYACFCFVFFRCAHVHETQHGHMFICIATNTCDSPALHICVQSIHGDVYTRKNKHMCQVHNRYACTKHNIRRMFAASETNPKRKNAKQSSTQVRGVVWTCLLNLCACFWPNMQLRCLATSHTMYSTQVLRIKVTQLHLRAVCLLVSSTLCILFFWPRFHATFLLSSITSHSPCASKLPNKYQRGTADCGIDDAIALLVLCRPQASINISAVTTVAGTWLSSMCTLLQTCPHIILVSQTSAPSFVKQMLMN